jgi:hypothetical protein
MGRTLTTHYRNFSMPLLLSGFAGGVALLAVFALQGKMPSVSSAAVPPRDEVERREVTVNLARPADGCRWIPPARDDEALIVHCGDRYDMELIVFEKERTVSYRVTVGNAPQAAATHTSSITQSRSTNSGPLSYSPQPSGFPTPRGNAP